MHAIHDISSKVQNSFRMAKFSGDSPFDAAGGGLLQDHEEPEQAQEVRLDHDFIGAGAAAVDAHAVFEGANPRAIRERSGQSVRCNVLNVCTNVSVYCVHIIHLRDGLTYVMTEISLASHTTTAYFNIRS